MSRKIFEHSFFPKFNVERVVIDGKRHYATPTGEKYPSVTTVLDQKLDKTALLKWRAKVGEAEANKISTQAANRGTAIHSICEHYLLNETNYPKGVMPINVDTFKKLRPLIDEHIGKVYALEYYMYSHVLKAAGATDCIADFDGVPTIVDFKTSRKLKKEEWIQNYFLQATAYAMMAEELLYEWQFKVPQIAIMIAVDNEEPQLFVKPKYLYEDEVRELFA